MSKTFVDKLLSISLLKTKYGKTQKGAYEQSKLVKSILTDCKFTELQKRKNPNKAGLYFIEQPFGTQNFPDFLLYHYIDHNNIKTLNLELKKSNTNKIMWNDGFPQDNSIYLFSGKFNLIFTKECMSNIICDKYETFYKKLNELKKEFKISKDEEFYFYPRKAVYQSIKEKNKNEYLNKSLSLIRNFFNESD